MMLTLTVLVNVLLMTIVAHDDDNSLRSIFVGIFVCCYCIVERGECRNRLS